MCNLLYRVYSKNTFYVFFNVNIVRKADIIEDLSTMD